MTSSTVGPGMATRIAEAVAKASQWSNAMDFLLILARHQSSNSPAWQWRPPRADRVLGQGLDSAAGEVVEAGDDREVLLGDHLGEKWRGVAQDTCLDLGIGAGDRIDIAARLIDRGPDISV